jgi:gamma-glutamyltranspeptidase/glutathione hydrolase
MMGEEDLHPGKFFSAPPGQRVPSMMSPSFIKKDKEIYVSLGSGGSNRIRSAILQVVLDVIDENKSVENAIEAPRMHFDENDKLQIEPGFSSEAIDGLVKEYPNSNIWDEMDMYFGGVHAVTGDLNGWGDSRRDGVFLSLL